MQMINITNKLKSVDLYLRPDSTGGTKLSTLYYFRFLDIFEVQNVNSFEYTTKWFEFLLVHRNNIPFTP